MMNNQIFNAIAKGQNPFGNMQNMIQQLHRLKQTFHGNPQDAINQMLQNGQITQDQLEQAKKTAQQFQNLMK